VVKRVVTNKYELLFEVEHEAPREWNYPLII